MSDPAHYRTILNNWGAQTGKAIIYKDVVSGPQHSQTWASTVYVDNVPAGKGNGTSKGTAKEMAARNALVAWRVI